MGKEGSGLELTRENIKKVALLVGGAILLYWALNNFKQVQSLLTWGCALVAPFILGLCIAFVVNVPMQAVERLFCRLAKRPKAGKVLRAVSLVVTILLMLVAIAVVMLLVVPEISNTVATVREAFPQFWQQVQAWSGELMERFPEAVTYFGNIKLDWDSIVQSVISFLQSGFGNVVGSTVTIIGSVFSGVTTMVLSLIFSIYVLLQKETLARQCKRALYAFLKEKRADRFLEICTLTSRTFSKFITGQCVEAVILGLMFFICMSIFRFPYALMVAVLISATALIPVFGAFIGFIVGALLILVVSPMQALWFAVMFLVLQQIEGNLIYPKVVGSSIGLPGIWVLAAVTVGGSAFGVVGMLVMVPVFSVLYTLFKQEASRRLAEKKTPISKLR
ncbi:MAG: AI-2E family transporter [Oscillospiraceae bacterium]|nr:AI-2E family transporter [Oscillospiraceae bacterium]